MILRHGTYNFLSLAIPLVIGLFTVPIIIEGLGVPRFGALTLVWAFIGYAGIFDFGIARALTKRIAEHKGDLVQTRTVANIGLALLAGLGLVIGCVITGLGLLFPLKDIGLDEEEYFRSVFLLGASIPVVILGGGLRGIIEGLHRFKVISAVRLCFGIFTFAFPVLLLPIAPTLDAILAAILVARIFGNMAMARACKENLWGAKVGIIATNPRIEAKELLRLGSWITLSNLASSLMVYLDRFIMTASPHAGTIALYTTPYEFVTKLFIVPSALTGVIFPRMAERVADLENNWKLLTASFAATLLLLAPATFGLGLFAEEILAVWINPEFATDAAMPLRILASGVLINSLAQISQVHLIAHGQSRWLAELQVLELILYVPALYFFLQDFGIEGVAMAWTLRVTADAIALFSKSGRFATKAKSSITLAALSSLFLGGITMWSFDARATLKLALWLTLSLFIVLVSLHLLLNMGITKKRLKATKTKTIPI